MTALNLTPFDTVLIANRGEIACRIIRTAKAMGLKTIAVYSEADAQAPHVKLADQAHCIGPAPVSESYLDSDKILKAAQRSGAQAIHPGYGFLSENFAFATACAEAGLIFIGPNPDAIDLMGDKAKAKRRMITAGVPCVPGYQGQVQDDKTLITQANSIGFPIMVKAAAGGGGRGMRLVTNAKALPDAIKDARSEAANAFGSDILILERAVQRPRHVEIQIFADRYGNIIHLGERDCSVQRRHQKVIEEAPCPVMSPALRTAMGDAAVKAAKDINYVGAGTVEFMLDAAEEFFFLEMNTRLQVEHPVTEMVTGLDLVKLQIRVAQGQPLGLSQADINLTGHAIEARLYAEDPASDFLPSTGTIHLFSAASHDDIRIDSGIATGGEVSPFYDPMLAKVIAHGQTREDARIKLIKALKDIALFGPKTNKSFLISALSRPEFVKGEATTAFILETFSQADLTLTQLSPRDGALAAITQFLIARETALKSRPALPSQLLNWTSASQISTPFQYGDMRIVITPQSASNYAAQIDGQTYPIDVLDFDENKLCASVEGQRMSASYHAQSLANLYICIDGRDYNLTNANAVIQSAQSAAGQGAVVSPMHGALLELFVSEGDSVTRGARLAIIEAMKMQHEILAEIDGIVSAIHVQAGTQIAADTLMIEIDNLPDEASK